MTTVRGSKERRAPGAAVASASIPSERKINSAREMWKSSVTISARVQPRDRMIAKQARPLSSVFLP